MSILCSIAQLNALAQDQFIDMLADIFEHSPWVARRVAPGRPFADVDALHRAMVQAVRDATADEQMALLRAHPELAGREAQHGELTAASSREQAGAGLKALSKDEMARISALNAAYSQRHAFPFIICVGHHTKQGIFDEFERRLGNDSPAEAQEALGQVAQIARLRLDKLLSP